MRIIRSNGSLYFITGTLFHKGLEVGLQWDSSDTGFDLYWRFRTRGDHAGLTFFFSFGRLLFEFNIHDARHWNWDTNTWETGTLALSSNSSDDDDDDE